MLLQLGEHVRSLSVQLFGDTAASHPLQTALQQEQVVLFAPDLALGRNRRLLRLLADFEIFLFWRLFVFCFGGGSALFVGFWDFLTHLFGDDLLDDATLAADADLRKVFYFGLALLDHGLQLAGELLEVGV